MSEADRLILAAATGARRLSRNEVRRVLEHVAQAGFDPHGAQSVTGKLAGLEWAGRTLQRGEEIPTGVSHYLRHLVVQEEWPADTTFEEYLASISAVVLDPTSGALVSQYQDKGWHLAVVQRAGPLRGPQGYGWVMVEYRVNIGHWMTAFQREEGPAHFDRPARKEKRWLRRPQ